VCRHYSRHYIRFAQKIQKLVAESNQETAPITFHAVSCVPNKPLCRKRKADAFPLITLLKPGETEGINIRHYDAKPIDVLKKLGIDVTGMREDGGEEEEFAVTTPIEQDEVSWWRSLEQVMFGVEENGKTAIHIQPFARRSRKDLRNDIHLSLDFALRNGVFTGQEDSLSQAQANALNEYLLLLQKTLPASWTDLHSLLAQLQRNWRYITKKEHYLIKILDKHPPATTSWSVSCSRGQEGQGFTCGLWETFHAATVGLIPFNSNQVTNNKLLAPATVAKIIRDYIEHFFQCDDCRRHFLTMFDNCGHNHCERLKEKAKLGLKEAQWEWEQPSLFYYEVHNAVNLRLMREKAAREGWEPTRGDVIASQWPPVHDCRPCWKEDANGNNVWKEDMVIKYLQLEYGQRDSNTFHFQRQLVEMNTDMEAQEKERAIVGEKSGMVPSHGLKIFMVANCILAFFVLAVTARRRKKRKMTVGSKRILNAA